MSLINCKVKLKLKWTMHFVISMLSMENADGNSNSIIFTIKDSKLYVLVVPLSA